MLCGFLGVFFIGRECGCGIRGGGGLEGLRRGRGKGGVVCGVT